MHSKIHTNLERRKRTSNNKDDLRYAQKENVCDSFSRKKQKYFPHTRMELMRFLASNSDVREKKRLKYQNNSPWDIFHCRWVLCAFATQVQNFPRWKTNETNCSRTVIRRKLLQNTEKLAYNFAFCLWFDRLSMSQIFLNWIRLVEFVHIIIFERAQIF